MTHPMLLLPFEGSLSGRDRGGDVSLTPSGTIAYTAGKSAGTQALQLSDSVHAYIPGVAGRLDHTQGAYAVRLRVNTSIPTATKYLLWAGSETSGAFMMAYQNTVDGTLRFQTRTNGTITAHTASGLPGLPTGNYTDRVLEWDESRIAIYSPSGLVTSVARTGSPSTNWVLNRIYTGVSPNTIHADVDSVLIFDRRLSDRDRERLFSADVWTWDILGSPESESQKKRAAKIAALHAGGWI